MYAYKMMNNHRVYTVHSINIYTVWGLEKGGGMGVRKKSTLCTLA